MRNVKLLPSFLLVLASLSFLYLRASFIAPPDHLVRPFLMLCLLLGGLSFPAYWLTRDGNWAGILLLVVVLGFFSSGIFAFSYSLAVLLTVLLLAATLRLLGKKFLASNFFLIANSISCIALFLSGIVLYQSFQSIPSSYYESHKELLDSENAIALDSLPATNPDIYYIILDGYGRASMLKELYGFDNSDFVHSLEERGFVVPKNSLSNYAMTVLSVTSTLNMEYVQAFAPGLEDSLFWWLMVPWLDHNRVRNSLDGIGYKSVSISSDWSITDNPTTDVYFKSHPLILSDFERYLFGVTPLKMFQPLIADFSSVSTFDMHRRSQINNFDSLVESVHIAGPKFVFAHIILPHPPFVFASDGTPIDPDYSFSFNDASDFEGTDLEYRDLYIGQMQFLNDKLEVVVDSILQNSTRPVIIILQADHGPGMLTDFTSASNTCLKERFSNFSAYYVPMIDKGAIPDDITPVNLFRIIFNGYFGTSLPLLENANYYPRQEFTVYELEDVTSLLDRRENCSTK